MGQLNVYSGAVAQQEAWFGQHLKIGLCKKDWLPNSGNYNLWFEGHCNSFKSGGGEREAESVSCFGGYKKQFQKPQTEYEISLDVLPTDTTFDEMQMGDDGFYVDLFDAYANSAAVTTAWTKGGDGGDAILDTTNFKSGKQAGRFPYTDSTHTSTWTYDLSTTLGATQNVSGFTGTGAANATRGRAEMFVYIPDATTLGHLTTISLTLGSDATHISKYDYTVSGNCAVGWNRIIYDLTTADSSTNYPDWTALDKAIITLVTSGTSTEYITIDRIRVYDPLIASDMVTGYWRLTLLYETSSTANVGEKRRMEIRDCRVTAWEPSSDADGELKTSITLKAPAMNASGNPNMLIEHTPDASEAALTAQSTY